MSVSDTARPPLAALPPLPTFPTRGSNGLRLLDLYSCAGAAAEGYHHAGFKEGLRPPPPWDLPGVTEGADVLAATSGHPSETGIKEGVDNDPTVPVDQGVAVPMELDIVQTAGTDQVVVVLQRDAGLFSHEPEANHVPQALKGTTA